MKVLFVLDPLKKLNKRWDNSLRLIGELMRRGHDCYFSEPADFFLRKGNVWTRCRRFKLKGKKRFTLGSPISRQGAEFSLVVIRKEPPVDNNYVRLTYVLERLAKRIPVINHPRGIRETNEKLSILHFPRWIPKTIVTSSAEKILQFLRKMGTPVVVKPLDQKGGRGVFLLRDDSPRSFSRALRATLQGTQKVMAQEFLKVGTGEKRIVLLHGSVFCHYEKRSRGKEFRANLTLGATFHKAPLTAQEKKICRDLKPFLLKRGLEFVGIDVLNGKLIEINVTSPAGVTEAIVLEPQRRLLEAWADSLEDFSQQPLF